MGVIRNEDYIEKPLNQELLGNYAKSLGSQELIPLGANLQTNLIPENSSFKFYVGTSTGNIFQQSTTKKFYCTAMSITMDNNSITGTASLLDIYYLNQGTQTQFLTYRLRPQTTQPISDNITLSFPIPILFNPGTGINVATASGLGGGFSITFIGYELDA